MSAQVAQKQPLDENNNADRINYQNSLGNAMRKVNAREGPGANGSVSDSNTPWFKMRDANVHSDSQMARNIVEEGHQDGNGGAGSGFMQHYEVPNLSSMLYEFTNKEADRITNCFRVGNYHSLRDLPKHLLPGNVSQVSQSKINENLYGAKESRSYIELQRGGGFFSKFEWQKDEYYLFLDKKKEERLANESAIQDVHLTNKWCEHSKKQLKHKHQNIFEGKLGSEQMSQAVVGYLAENDPYEASAFEVLRAKWIQDSKKIYGDFLSSHGNNSLRVINKQHLPQAVGYIKRRLLADWSDINFIIGTNPEDYIELRFVANNLDAPTGLKAYMNNLVDQDEELTKYCLRRISQYWGVTSGGHALGKSSSHGSPTNKSGNSPSGKKFTFSPGGAGEETYIYYMLGPQWARHKAPILYLSQLSANSSQPETNNENHDLNQSEQ